MKVFCLRKIEFGIRFMFFLVQVRKRFKGYPPLPSLVGRFIREILPPVTGGRVELDLVDSDVFFV